MNSRTALPLSIIEPEPHPCSYLDDRLARHEFLYDPRLTSEKYQSLMDEGFRRSGAFVYRPVCEGCGECIPLRVPVDRFVASRSQRRAMVKNVDVRIEQAPPALSEEKWELYQRYQAFQHGAAPDDDKNSFQQFLYNSPVETIEMTYRLGERIVGVGIIDVCPEALSSVYFYFDPECERRSLGVFSALCEIQECRRRGKTWWYAGYFVRECRKMNYKAQFAPYELLKNGSWKSGETF